MLVFNTICEATEKRQTAACELAGQVDAVVVVGGRNSANTARLAQLCRAIEPRTFHIETAAELRAEWMRGCRRIGVTAGASTPEEEIAATIQALESLCAQATDD
jgi:4-hydroxy-3-methylbut-2-enyl diphosphate reductase